MKKNHFQQVGLAVFLVGLVVLLPGCPGDPFVYFPDTALESAVRESINKPFGFLTQSDLERVREINAAGLGIRNLKGLEYCIFATKVNLRSNRIQSIAPLASLENLRWLDLGDNIIRDIEPLSGLFQLEYLNLFGVSQEIWVWEPLVANALSPNASLGNMGTVVLPVRTTLYSDNTLQEHFVDDYTLLLAAGVTVIFADDSGQEIEF